MIKANQIRYLALDWGTTNFRAFAMDEQGQVVDEQQAKLGLLQVANGQFAQTLESILVNWIDEYQSLPIVMAGMVGSAQGWKAVDYLNTPLNCQQLGQHLYQFELPWGACAYIVPGIASCNSNGGWDVMRGEEVQLLGLQKLVNEPSMQVILPGTHSKHLVISDSNLIHFETYMTGELYSVLTEHSLLGRGLPPQVVANQVFLKGILDSQQGGLSHLMFLARSARLFKQIEENEVSDYLSGILIGYELRSVQSKKVYLVGGDSLTQGYQTACQSLGIEVETYSGDACFIAGIDAIKP